MTFLYRYSIRFPKLAVIISVIVTLAAAPGMLRLELRTDGHALVPNDAPEVRYDKSIRDEFGIKDPIVVVIRTDHSNGIFNTNTLRLVQDLNTAFGQIEGIQPVDLFSLATEHNNRVFEGTLTFRTFLEPLPTTQEELNRLQSDLLGIQLYTGTLVSLDKKGTSILIGVPPELDRGDLYGTIRDIIAARGPTPDTIHVIGAPVAEALLGTHILEDLGVPSAVLGARIGWGEETEGWHLPRTLYELRVLIARRIGLVPIAIVVMMIVFLIAFRSPVATLLPMTEVAACLVMVFGLMGWLGIPVYLTIAVLPVILAAMGVADEIHIFSRYIQLLRDRPGNDHIGTVTTTMNEMWVPVAKTSVTTAVGFLSFALSPIAPVRVFGVFTAIGIVFCMLWSLTAIPALLTLIKPHRFVRASRTAERATNAGCPTRLARLGIAIARYRYVVLAAAALLIAVTPFGARQVIIQDSWIDGFAPESEFHRATSLFNQQFLGTHLLLVAADAGHETLTGELDVEANARYPLRLPGNLVDGDPKVLKNWHIRLRPIGIPPAEQPKHLRRRQPREWDSWVQAATRDGDHIVVTTARRYLAITTQMALPNDARIAYEITPRRFSSPDVLRQIADLEAFIESRTDCAVGGAIGTASYIETTNYMVSGSKENRRRIPDAADANAKLWRRFEEILGKERIHQVVNADNSRSLTTIFLRDANFIDTARLMAAIRNYEQTKLTEHQIKLGFAGDVAVSQTLIGAIVSTQFRSLMVSLIGIFAVATVLSRSLRLGIYSVLPCALAVLVNFAVMGWTGMPLGVATSMFAGMTLGIGVDFAIHLIERCRLARSRGLAANDAIADAVAVAGPAIIIDALGIALGFGVLMLSQVPANARLGGLVVLSIAGCLAGTLLLLPALLRLWSPRAQKTASSVQGMRPE